MVKGKEGETAISTFWCRNCEKICKVRGNNREILVANL